MGPILATAASAFLAAWLGATFAFRRTRKERALDHKVAWHENTIRALARYEGALERLHRESRYALVVQREGVSMGEAGALSVPDTFRASQEAWSDLSAREKDARELLRLADLFTEGRAKIEASVGLGSTVDLVTRHWLDIGSSPTVQWTNLATRILSVERLRRYLQESLRITLELDGLAVTVLGPRYRRWRTLRELDRVRKELGITGGDLRVTPDSRGA